MTVDPLIDQTLALGLLVIGGGLLMTLIPGPIAAMDETFDAVGSKRSNVEPTRWRIWLTRIAGIVLMTIGGAVLLRYYGFNPFELL
ncbi:MAG: hypothetical protein ABEI76_10175 [Halobacteriales archaeon]